MQQRLLQIGSYGCGYRSKHEIFTLKTNKAPGVKTNINRTDWEEVNEKI